MAVLAADLSAGFRERLSTRIVFPILRQNRVTRLVAGMLFQVTPTNPMAFGVTSTALALVAFGATLIPALRAVSVSPILAIRYELSSRRGVKRCPGAQPLTQPRIRA